VKYKTVPRGFRVGLNTRFDVVAGKEPGVAIHDALPPAIVVLLDDVDNRSFVERQLIVLVLLVAVDGNHCNSATQQ